MVPSRVVAPVVGSLFETMSNCTDCLQQDIAYSGCKVKNFFKTPGIFIIIIIYFN